ncbi:hypothetical protein GCM10022384_67470 [Streptomyces marokkonensis]|uniref:p-aminobenzoate N-oxygenase AurF n=2 Tax=Streptomyces marokkonensis TaxID=324855 RepID=A0ABP7SM43_9ACTN
MTAATRPETGGEQDLISGKTLRRISDAWLGRATIRTDLEAIEQPDAYQEGLPDYPVRLLPFAEHPDFLAASPEQREQVLTSAWIAYNERVIAAEEKVANPTFARIVHGVFPGADSFEIKRSVQQAHVDETWHTYMHMMAMQRTRDVRGITDEPEYPPTVTYRMLAAAQADASEAWKRDLLALVWTTVSEISVNAYLELLSRDKTIQPLHSLVPRLHAKDESAHGSVMVEVAKALYVHMNAEQRQAFADALPRALHAFVAQDFKLWPVVLRHAGIRKAEDIVEDCKRAAGSNLLVRDFSGVRRVVRGLGLEDQVDFDFADTAA